MMRRIFGNHKMKILFVSLMIIFSSVSIAVACPACAVVSPQKDPWHMFWILSVMGILPLGVAGVIALCITRVHKNE